MKSINNKPIMSLICDLIRFFGAALANCTQDLTPEQQRLMGYYLGLCLQWGQNIFSLLGTIPFLPTKFSAKI